MANNRALNAVIEFLKPQHFADPVHGRIFRECARRILAGGIADPISLRSWFEGDPDLSQVGGVGYLAKLLGAMVGIINAPEYAKVIYDAWMRREIIGVAEDLANTAYSPGDAGPADAFLPSFIARLDAVSAGADETRQAVSLDGAMDAALQAAEQALRQGRPAGTSTGMPAVDRSLGGLERQALIVLAGRPGMGKSALGLQWALHAARDAKAAQERGEPKRGVLIVSLEMSGEQIGRRVLAAAARIAVTTMKHGALCQGEFDRLTRARRELHGLPLSIEDSAGMSIGLIRLKARLAARRHGLGLVVVDHLHIVKPEEADARHGATQSIGKISNSLKRLAKEFDVPVLALAQLNRGLESRDDKRPTLADLRQSGEIEQDGDAIIFIYRPEYYHSKSDPERQRGESQAAYSDRVIAEQEQHARVHGKAELILAKVRDGSPTTIGLRFDGATTSFTEDAQ